MRFFYLLCAAAVFLSTLLLGCLVPWSAKMILPRVGGSPAGWYITMVVCGGTMAMGYGTGFLCTRLRSVRAQALVVSLVWMSIVVVTMIWFSEVLADDFPWFWVLPVTLVGAACSANFVMLPSWVAALSEVQDSEAALDPYPILAAGFLGVFVSVLGYSLAVEPLLIMHTQAMVWQTFAACTGLLVGGAAACGWKLWPLPGAAEPTHWLPHVEEQGLAGPIWQRYRWVLLTAMPVALAQSTTSYIAITVAPIPLFWILPLSLTHLTLVLALCRVRLRPEFPLGFSLAIQAVSCLSSLLAFGLLVATFDVPPWPAYGWALLVTSVVFCLPHRATLWLQVPATLAAVAFFCAESFLVEPLPLTASLLLLLTALWLNCWGCHGVLAADRPKPAQAAEFLLWILFGAVLGGLINELAPHLFPSTPYDYPLLLFSACAVRFLPPWKRD